MKYGGLTLGQIEAIVNKLGGVGGVHRFLSGELAVKETEHNVWETIKLGTGLKVADDFRRLLRKAECQISNQEADDMMNKSAFVGSLAGVDPEEEYDLVRLTTAQLTGRENGGTIAEVFAGADRLGLKKCLAWMGPKLRSEYLDQPDGGWIFIGMEPIADSDGVLHVFVVERNGSLLWLRSNWCRPGHVWHPGDLWVFVRPRK